MVILIAGTTHTGKTALAQRLLEKYKIPYLSLDHLKMGLIRSGQTKLSVYDDEELTGYLWNIAKEMVKTAIENGQNLIIEGCYIPFDWRVGFSEEELAQIKYYCLIMSENYIRNNFSLISEYANIVEKRVCDCAEREELITDNKRNLELCKRYGLNYILSDKFYNADIEL